MTAATGHAQPAAVWAGANDNPNTLTNTLGSSVAIYAIDATGAATQQDRP